MDKWRLAAEEEALCADRWDMAEPCMGGGHEHEGATFSLDKGDALLMPAE
jgi:hypothetical protein